MLSAYFPAFLYLSLGFWLVLLVLVRRLLRVLVEASR